MGQGKGSLSHGTKACPREESLFQARGGLGVMQAWGGRVQWEKNLSGQISGRGKGARLGGRGAAGAIAGVTGEKKAVSAAFRAGRVQ